MQYKTAARKDRAVGEDIVQKEWLVHDRQKHRPVSRVRTPNVDVQDQRYCFYCYFQIFFKILCSQKGVHRIHRHFIVPFETQSVPKEKHCNGCLKTFAHRMSGTVFQCNRCDGYIQCQACHKKMVHLRHTADMVEISVKDVT